LASDQRPPEHGGTNGEATPDPRFAVSRRSFVQTLGLSAAATSISGAATAIAKERKEALARRADEPQVLGPEPIDVALKINGKPVTTKVDPATTLMEALRVNLGMTGAKEICDRGACGGCSVLVDGKLTVSCMMLAADAVGSEIITVEGLAQGDKLDPIQESFVRHDALQCGFCTPGLVMACKAVLNKTPKPTVDQIKKGLSGNICRCGTYSRIREAIKLAAQANG
jgi:carbon-monoxide dehydrogenase small subunit/xanthine dehydrogenase YagT iron-sulfur-binding subunit